MVNRQVTIEDTPTLGADQTPDGRTHAFVNNTLETQSRVAAIEPALAIGGIATAGVKPHRRGDRAGRAECRLQRPAITIAQALIGVDVEKPGTRGLIDREVTRGREIVVPGEVEYLGPVTRGKLRTAIGGAGVYNYDLVNNLIE
jgi:hypothetical protein